MTYLGPSSNHLSKLTMQILFSWLKISRNSVVLGFSSFDTLSISGASLYYRCVSICGVGSSACPRFPQGGLLTRLSKFLTTFGCKCIVCLAFTSRLWCSCSNCAPAVVITFHQGLPQIYWVISHNCCFLNLIHQNSIIQLLVIVLLLSVLRIDMFVHLTGFFQEEWCSSYEYKGAFWVCCGSIPGWGSNWWVSWKGTFPDCSCRLWSVLSCKLISEVAWFATW